MSAKFWMQALDNHSDDLYADGLKDLNAADYADKRVCIFSEFDEISRKGFLREGDFGIVVGKLKEKVYFKIPVLEKDSIGRFAHLNFIVEEVFLSNEKSRNECIFEVNDFLERHQVSLSPDVRNEFESLLAKSGVGVSSRLIGVLTALGLMWIFRILVKK